MLESKIIYTSQREKIDPKKQLPPHFQSSEACEDWLLNGGNPLSTNEKSFVIELETALKVSESTLGFRDWAETNLPKYPNTNQQFPLGSGNFAFLYFSGYEVPGLESLYKNNENPSPEEIYEVLKPFFTDHEEEIATNFKELRVFGYPIVLVMDERYWPRPGAGAIHYPQSFILLKGYDVELSKIRSSLIHELTHAILNHPNINARWLELSKEELENWKYYGPLDAFNQVSREETRRNVKNRILDVFREEVETYYHDRPNISVVLKSQAQDWFNYAFAQVEDFDRDPKEFEQDPRLISQERKFKDPLNAISLVEIYKYDPEFGDELDRTLKFWKMILENSSPARIEKIIDFIQSSSSFDQISIKNLSFISNSGIFAKPV